MMSKVLLLITVDDTIPRSDDPVMNDVIVQSLSPY